ncbi:hypothetical protein COU76_00035 [Candidatus Peregrinibacteria bacterium CG10_big_fil_rev_8_21_14_0_10_49_10]|nr:MAG: hypothetical protein COU76_00035 [Candidatus Peregrinibacteria bacterium CG10_big_fil_rev_8_21_14_0_10_49_10]
MGVAEQERFASFATIVTARVLVTEPVVLEQVRLKVYVGETSEETFSDMKDVLDIFFCVDDGGAMPKLVAGFDEAPPITVPLVAE